MSSLKITVGKRLRKLLQQHDKSARDLAAFCGMSTGNLYLIMLGEQGLTVEAGKKVSKFFSITLDELYDEHEEIFIRYRVGPEDNLEEVQAEIQALIDRHMVEYRARKLPE